MDLVQLRYFERVASLGSISKAAQELHVAQPAVTRQIRLLEEEFGTPLLLRHNRGIYLTDAGMQLREGATALLKLARHVRETMAATSAEPAGPLSLGFVPSTGARLVSPTASGYVQRNPKVKLRLAEAYSHVLREWLLSDRVDLAVMANDGGNPLLITEPLIGESLWLVGPPGRLRRKQMTMAEIADLPLIQPSRANALLLLLERSARAQGVHLNLVVEAEAASVIGEMVRSGAGFHISPYTAVCDQIEAGTFSGCIVKGLKIGRALVRRADRPVTRAMAAMIQALREESARMARTCTPHVWMTGPGDEPAG